MTDYAVYKEDISDSFSSKTTFNATVVALEPYPSYFICGEGIWMLPTRTINCSLTWHIVFNKIKIMKTITFHGLKNLNVFHVQAITLACTKVF